MKEPTAIGLFLFGAFWPVVGVVLIVFAGAIQSYALRYQPPGWEQPSWNFCKDHFMRGPGYLLTIRLAGLAGIIIGVAALLAAFR